MNKNLLGLLLVFAVSTHADTLESTAPQLLLPQQQQSQAAALSARFLTRFHYKATPLDDAMSEKIFDRYLKALDPERLFFTQSDINQFSSARTKLDDAIYQEDLNIPFAIFNLYEKRLIDRLTYARDILKKGFDFTQQESYSYAREKEPWPQSEDEAKDLWRKRVKNDWLRLKLAGKDEAAIRETLDKRYTTSINRIRKYKSDDAFQMFMNAYATSIEPHTNYLGPRASEDFDIAMKLSLIGIGAVLQERDDYTTIRELVAGGPASLSGQLKVGDRIVGVGQGKNGALTEVIGWRIDDVVNLIRGAKDTVVTLDILPADASLDGKHQLVTLLRDKIKLEQQAAKKSIIPVKSGNLTRQIGVISLPTFYLDFDAKRKGDKDFRSATRDISRLLEELKKEKVDSVLIDLRNNGGGSLAEAIELTGLFIDKGPVVQQRNSQGKISVESDNDAGVAWNGPLGVLINRGSASASEIFAAAIQDYGRGVIIGEPSFGKGTVQTLISLDQMAQNTKPKFGELKMTIAQFFRINGGTTQLRGVTPDISFPSLTDPENFGESSYDNALPWSQIKPADYKPTGDLSDLLPMLQVRYESRTAKDKDFQYLQEDIAEVQALRKKKLISLNEAERRKEKEAQEAKVKQREAHENGGKTATKTKSKADDGLQANERNLAADIAAEKEQKDAKDVLLNEAVHILSDEVDLLKTNAKLAARVLPANTLNYVPKRD
ncbi:carboxy terminal-processing peptidase [Undibacterium sp. Jales W-56]|uniref:carboxy terminal-processing peptidase n=1 Tax=Undibacterium sp. Jales W-56 TaxID=2897325 RepID=UPI0021CF8A6D|nr:carboxy terminal-processing peptidase [Undibacterium sp. Jales W-56]MCU6435085.1 carboxy terminal-processing peptidase [Undibacterium sp. Jales W-56]